MYPLPGEANPGKIHEEKYHRKGRDCAGSKDSQVSLEGGEEWELEVSLSYRSLGQMTLGCRCQSEGGFPHRGNRSYLEV